MIADRIWDEADSFGAARLVRRFEAAWRASNGKRPDPADFLPGPPEADPAALLALLRADLALRREAGEPARVEPYVARFPALDEAALVALLYEEFCLREEAGESPDMAEYEARFPAASGELRQVLEIHSLVRSGRSAPLLPGLPGPPATPFPEAGQTIAGFRLVEELGRGAFARVFRAEERQLADRPVALKVTRAASREPQALARLQHTHIVPVYSYRTDPVTGLHLLCMPYLGRVTLADLLALPRARDGRKGSDLVAALDELGAADDPLADRPSGRRALAARSQARAIAWWGARLAEALQHAHDRGVLHRDLKPSNVLIAGDGLPMLLDFNLAQESWVEVPDGAPSALGGTLAYMAPEHLEALAEGATDRVDARADVYALGVVLFEALAGGTRPFAPPSGVASVLQALRRAAEERRADVPRLLALRADVPPELDVVVRRCLAPDPDDRYATASELAEDLQAVADDAPLRFAHEPFPHRLRRWVRRNRRPLALAAPPLLALAALAVTVVNAELDTLKVKEELSQQILDGKAALRDGELNRALVLFASASRQAAGYWRLRSLRDEAEERYGHTFRSLEVRVQVDKVFEAAERLRFGLLGFGHDPRSAVRGIEALWRRLSIPDKGWTARPEFGLLDQARRERLRAEADELLFLWVVALDRAFPDDPRRDAEALRLCNAARSFVAPGGPWLALRERYAARLEGRPPRAVDAADFGPEASARACFQWGLLQLLEGRPDATIAWLERAVALRPDDYWSQFYLAYRYEQAGQVQRAIEHDNVAVALRPRAPWALYNRAKLFVDQGDWGRARADVSRALAADPGFVEARLESGLVRQHFADAAGARADYEAVIASGAKGEYARAARQNLANLDLEAGAIDRARTSYEALLAEDPNNRPARLCRALLALRDGHADPAEADLTCLLGDSGMSGAAAELLAHRATTRMALGRGADALAPAELLVHRAMARIALGRGADALADADAALRLRPGPGRERLRVRALLAGLRDRDLFDLLILDDPDEVDRLPAGGPPLAPTLRAAAARLRLLADGGGAIASPALRTRAALLASLGDPAAEKDANRALMIARGSADAYLVQARVRRRLGDRAGALHDAGLGLIVAPGHPRLLELRGLLLVELGRPEEALADLDLALARGARGTARTSRARALMALGKVEPALDDWTLALALDPEDPDASLGRALAFLRLGRWDDAVADLEQAVALSEGRPKSLARAALAYATCLPSRRDRLPRVLALAKQAGSTWLTDMRATPGTSGKGRRLLGIHPSDSEGPSPSGARKSVPDLPQTRLRPDRRRPRSFRTRPRDGSSSATGRGSRRS